MTKTAWRVKFPGNIFVYLTLARVPDFVVAARWYPKPAGKSRFYTYSCAPEERRFSLSVKSRRQAPISGGGRHHVSCNWLRTGVQTQIEI